MVNAPIVPTEHMETLDFRNEVPQELADSLSAALNLKRIQLGVKGLSAALRLPDGSIWADASGVSEENPEVPMTADHRLCMGSVSKTLIAATVLDLYEEGLFSLDDNLSHFGLIYNNVDSNVTIRQLLQHRSGIYNYTGHPLFNPTLQSNPNIHFSLEQIVTQFVANPVFAPGASFSYSNTNYQLLALVIESVTDSAFYEVVRARIIDPLQLEQTFLPAEEGWQSPVGHIWLDTNGDQIVDDFHQVFTTWTALLSAVAAPGGYFTTPSDLVEWIYQMHAGNLLEQTTIDEMHQTVTTNLPGGSRYGLGITRRSFLNNIAWGHGGDISYASQAFYFPEKGISIAVQDNDATAVSWDLDGTMRALLQECMDYEAAHPTANEELTPKTKLNLFPNPCKDYLNVDFDLMENVEWYTMFSILNSLGAVVQTGMLLPSSRQQSINTSELVPGVYYLQLESEGGRQLQTFVKMGK
ncbi:MAG: hypothetical protein DHS20C18_28330 [Saprospiraceae bacterium]|nr:MAG: hypothetical protein DHS20C18_28330 [Saprospiraceae bacterium]